VNSFWSHAVVFEQDDGDTVVCEQFGLMLSNTQMYTAIGTLLFLYVDFVSSTSNFTDTISPTITVENTSPTTITEETTSPALHETTPGPPVSDPFIYIVVVCGIVVVGLIGSCIYARMSRIRYVSAQVQRWSGNVTIDKEKEELMGTNLHLTTQSGTTI
jgi:hypothetical protein